MKATKYILLVGMPGGRLSTSAEVLKGIDYQVLQVPALDPALKLVDHFPHLSLVLIEEEVGLQGGRSFVNNVKEHHPNLPIIWACAGQQPSVVFDQVEPDIILPCNFEPTELRKESHGLLCEHFYPSYVIQELVASGNSVLVNSFKTSTSITDPALKTTQKLFGDTNALVTFSGDRIAGHVVVSANQKHLAALYQRIMPGIAHVSKEEGGDLAGEIGNQILGRFKQFFQKYSRPFALGLPIILYGSDLAIGYSTRRPTLMIGFQEEPGTIYLDFGFEIFDPEDMFESDTNPEEILESGEILFL